MYKLDNRDLKILNVVSDNARLSYSEIAKLTNISKDSVKARLSKLAEEQYILSFMPLIDYGKLGYTMFHVYIKLETSLENEEEFLKAAINNGNVVAVTKLMGKCDFELQVLAKDVIDEYIILDKLFAGFKKGITDLRVLTIIRYHNYTMAIGKFFDEVITKVPSQQKRPSKEYSADAKDFEILKVLSVNARESLINIAKKVSLSPESTRYRINMMLNSGIIKRFYARTNKNIFGLTTYLFLLDIEGTVTSKDIQFAKTTKNIYYLRDCLGNWNLNIGFYAETNKELFDTIHNIRKDFGSRLNRFDLLVPLHRYKFVPLPSAIKPR